ncbi:hypothetical protein [Zavarzinella formosa]|uniref:hypothetical protein n=1 Tax=Zavarzinella formosa TaxID=360055 RepID=UPI0002DA2487|nr:hypothetical protein [Zavarzinella formosa]
MTADEFIAALAGLQGKKKLPAGVRRRRKALFAHPDDPVLELLARYEVAGLEFWQLKFSAKTASEIDGVWHVATKATDDYYVEGGRLLKMYYKEDYPAETGLTSGQFLEVIVVYARLIAAMANSTLGMNDPLIAEHAGHAVAISPKAAGLDWFEESWRRRAAGNL